MDKKINVYLQYPWRYPDSPYYKYLVDNPPEGFGYLNIENQKGAITNKKKFWFSNFLKRNIRRSLHWLNLAIPNAHLSPKGNYNLIHCAHCLSKNKDKPWVADIEMMASLAISGITTKKGKEKVNKILTSKNCKKIMPWTKKTANEIISEFPEIKNKVEIIYPAIPLNVDKKIKKKKNEKITIIYATRYFWLKGGLIALEVLQKLKKRYNDKIEIIFISDIDDEKLKERYNLINMLGLVSVEKLFEFYSKSDIYFYPSFVDTFGFGILEAMSFGLPIVSVNTMHTKTRNEIIENGKTGLMFDVDDNITLKVMNEKENLRIGDKEKEIINKLVNNCSRLIEDSKLSENISNECINEVKKGKFSIKNRNQKLKKIYFESIK